MVELQHYYVINMYHLIRIREMKENIWKEKKNLFSQWREENLHIPSTELYNNQFYKKENMKIHYDRFFSSSINVTILYFFM